MPIDPTGRKPPPPTPPATAGEPQSPGVGATPPPRFDASGAPPAQPAAVASAPTPLDRWRAGEIDLNGYLDEKVRESTAHLAGLPPAELEAVRRALRERLASDPTLVDLVRAATGSAPEPPPAR